MDNPEEVLQALDEFQKMRPSEIPRELEEYLSYVAKTGDPIYQWSLIKPLFREKLVRVMTDFYESCPTLDLATSPNLEHFNYDIMKCNLLELLESFANAPFTVQRICELLTAPRKEYNRVDKFMRAIEKNILVVSTKEPGPAARRSENGDSMVNGSLDEEMPSQTPHEVEMESWVKDCTTTTTSIDTPIVPAPAGEIPVVQADKFSKAIPTPEDTLPIENTEQPPPRPEITVASFISAAHEMTNNASLTPAIPASEIIISGSHVQNSSGTIAELSSGHVNDVPEGIMNEDTSSQPSLDSESDECEGHTTKKLQTTFQAKDFIKLDTKSSKFYPENGKTEIKSSMRNELNTHLDESSSPIQREDGDSKSDEDSKSSCDSNPESVEKRPRLDADAPIVINKTEHSESCISSVISTKIEENSTSESSDSDSTIKLELNTEAENTKEASTEEPVKITESPSNEGQSESTFTPHIPVELTSNSTSDSQSSTESESVKESPEDSNLTSEPSKGIVEEPTEDNITKNLEKDPTSQPESTIVIEEAMDDDEKPNESLIPDPIPIIEEPKDELAIIENIVPIISEVSDYDKSNDDETSMSQQNIEEPTSIAPTLHASTDLSEAVHIETTSSVMPNISEAKVELSESMEVDNEESMQFFPQDEPMEQESSEPLRS